MYEPIKRTLLRVLRVPPEPHPPSGSPESIRTFRASRNYYRYKMFGWGVKQIGALIGIIVLAGVHVTFGLGSHIPWTSIPAPESVTETLEKFQKNEVGQKVTSVVSWFLKSRLVLLAEIVGFAFLIVQAPVTYAMVQLDYEMRWYIVTDRSLRIREGIASVREMTMTFANVQNLTIQQGPIQRLLGISDLRVRTAGGGSSDKDEENKDKEAESMHVGYLRGVDDAQEIRDTILDRLRRVKGAGLGDPEDESAARGVTSTAEEDLIAASRELLGEARALRRVVG
jgi:membrane protein YdbS with pleckstrin-like domain